MNDKDNKLQNDKKPQFSNAKDVKLSKSVKALSSNVMKKFTSIDNLKGTTEWLKVEGNHLRNEMARVTSKGTSSVSGGGTFNHELAKGYLDACNGYYMQRNARNNININLARQYGNKEAQWLLRRFSSPRK